MKIDMPAPHPLNLRWIMLDILHRKQIATIKECCKIAVRLMDNE